MEPQNKKRKILVIGWDAADWKVINPLMDEGVMPTLNALVNQSTISNLATLDPPLSPMLWTSIATGKRPYKHGIIGFTETGEDGKTVKPVTIRNRKCKALWNMLSDNGYKTHVIGWWPSHPAEKINGISISNFYQRASHPITEPWPMKPGTVSPEEKSALFAQMRVHPAELTENHIAAFVPHYGKVDQKKSSALATLARILADNASIHAAATYILEYEDWDFLGVYYDGIDHFNHAFMKYHPPRRDFISESDFEIYKHVVTAGYRFHDLMLKRLLQLAGDDCTVLLISDHGFHPDHQRKKNIPRELAGPAAEHSQYGIFCLKGEGIKKDEIIYGSSVLDITPTILTLLGLPVGDDMDGKALTSAFEKEIKPTFIPTWEDHQYQPMTSASNDETDSETLQQLVDLGYIEDPGLNKEEAGTNTIRENNFFLARAYMDGNRHQDAVAVLEKLFSENPAQSRFASSLCNCYQKLLQFEKVNDVLKKYKAALEQKFEEDKKEAIGKVQEIPEYKIPNSLLVMEATLLMSQNKARQALEILESIPNEGAGKIYLKTGVCYTMLEKWDDAISNFEKELEFNYDEHEAHHGIGYCLLRQKKYNDSIEYFLNAIGLRFNYPVAHYHLAEAFYYTGLFDEALRAYEVCLKMEPGMNKARLRISKIMNENLQQQESAAEVKTAISENLSGTIYIVSGLPRSGTSLMMQMLVAGGMTPFTDEKRLADESNPRGYYEHEAVLRLKRDSSWLNLANGKVVKIVSPLLASLPPRFKYKIIFMERDILEVMNSQQVMLQKSGKTNRSDFSVKVLNSYRQNLEQITNWSEKNKSFVEMLRIPFENLFTDPQKSISQIAEFLSTDLNTDRMISAIDPLLYRTKIKVNNV